MAHPERLARLVLSDAAACFPPEGRQQLAIMADKVAEAGLGSIAEIAAKRVFSPACLAAHPEAIEAEFRGPKGREWLMRWLPSRAHDNGLFISLQ